MSACQHFELSGCRHDLSVAISGSRPVCSPIVCSCELCVTSCKTKLLSQGPSSSIVQNGRENPQVFTALIPKSHFLPAIIRRRIFFYPKEFAYKGTCVTRTHAPLATNTPLYKLLENNYKIQFMFISVPILSFPSDFFCDSTVIRSSLHCCCVLHPGGGRGVII